MISSVSGSPLAAGMRMNDRTVASGGRLAAESQTGGSSAASGSARKQGVAENFKNAIQERIARYQQSGQADNASPQAARALADSVARSAHEVREVYGQDAANAFMAGVLKKIDEKGFSQEALTDAVSAAVRDVAQTGTSR